MNDFRSFKMVIQNNLTKMTNNYKDLFVTDVNGDELWNLYLSSFPAGTNNKYIERTEHDCSACRSFIKHYGGIVTIAEDNSIITIWDNVKGFDCYDVVSEALSNYVKSKNVIGLFLSSEKNMGINSNKQDVDGKIITWEHFYYSLPERFIIKRIVDLNAKLGEYVSSKNVFKRSMEELTYEAGEIILDLIEQNSLYRGEEFKEGIKQFIRYKNIYSELNESEKDNWCWKCFLESGIARIRNTAMGTLLIDLSDDVEIDIAVNKFDKIMCPTNYKRPAALITKKMIENAEKDINELGFTESLGRRYATIEDISVNDVIYVNRGVKNKLKDSIFDAMKEDVSIVNPKQYTRVEEVQIEDFIKNILPSASNIEILFENKLQNNLVSLIAPKDINAKTMFKWDNNFCWSYNGDIADSLMKQNVKNAGGNVDGVLRFSIQWNEDGKNNNDFDAHCIEPNGNEISYVRKVNPITAGNLDVDIINPAGKVAVENITWLDINKMKEGQYKFFVRNFNHRGGISGFKAEIEYNGQIYSYEYNRELKHKEDVIVAEINFDKKNGISFIRSLDANLSSKSIWGMKTNTYNKVSAVTFSPNYWGDKKLGNKHYLFFMEGCKNPNTTRGFYNEFLKEDLTKHRKVFEVLGSKMRVESSENQLSGLGFSSTQKNDVIVKVEGSFNRVIRLIF
jgi:hypothetical protein